MARYPEDNEATDAEVDEVLRRFGSRGRKEGRYERRYRDDER